MLTRLTTCLAGEGARAPSKMLTSWTRSNGCRSCLFVRVVSGNMVDVSPTMSLTMQQTVKLSLALAPRCAIEFF
jgi:hypothetical protein